MQKWTQGVGAMNHGVEVSRLDAMVHGAEVLDAASIYSDVALAKKNIYMSAPQISAPSSAPRILAPRY